MAFRKIFHRFTDYPLGATTKLYAAGVLGVLVYDYFELRTQM